MSAPEWHPSEPIAWTRRDGPGQPPSGPPRALFAALAAALGAVFVGMSFTDTLCPEHRAWVQGLASVAFVGAALSVVGLLRRWAFAPLLTAGVCALGMGIGLIDAIHAPQRGLALAVVFAALTLACLAATAWVVRLWSWDRAIAASLTEGAAATPATSGTATSAATEPSQVDA